MTPRRRLALALTSALLASLAAALLAAPEVLQGARAERDACARRVDASLSADPAACAPSALLALPLASPFTRADALAFQREAAASILALRLRRATAPAPDAAARDAHAADLLAFADASPLLLLDLGAFAPLAAAAPTSPARRAASLQAAGVLGDRAAARRLAAAPDGAAPPALLRTLGALRCLEGQRAEGRATLRAAPPADALLPAAACADPDTPLPPASNPAPSPADAELLAALRSVALPPAADPARLTAPQRLLRAALALSDPHAPAGAAPQLLRLIAPEGLHTSGLQGPDLLLLGPESLLQAQPGAPLRFLSPEVASRGADALAGLGALSTRATPDERAALHAAAARLELHAARAAARLRRFDVAAAAAQRAAQRDPALTPDAALTLIAADAPDAALRLLTAHPDPTPTLRRRLAFCLAHADLGHLASAFDEATAALRHILRDPAPPSAEALALTWLWCALQLLTRRPIPTDLPLPTPPERLADAHPRDLTTPFLWRRAALASPDDQLPLLLHLAPLDLPPDVLPAAMILLAHLTPPGGDPEVLLDRAFAAQALASPRPHRVARARAARWRGDAPAAQRWQHAEAQARTGADTPATALLADVAGF